LKEFPTGKNLDSVIKRVAFDALVTGAEGIIVDIIDETPIKTGTLRRSQTVTPHRARLTVSISANTPYAHALHEGSPPHDIAPDKAKALAFKVGGEVIYRKRVHHPGTKGNPWMRRTVEKKLSTVGKYVTGQVTNSLPEGLR